MSNAVASILFEAPKWFLDDYFVDNRVLRHDQASAASYFLILRAPKLSRDTELKIGGAWLILIGHSVKLFPLVQSNALIDLTVLI